MHASLDFLEKCDEKQVFILERPKTESLSCSQLEATCLKQKV